MSMLLIGAALALIVGAVVYAGRTPHSVPATAATPYVPPDGHVEILHAGTSGVATYEWAELSGARFLTSGPIEFQSLNLDIQTIQSRTWYRATVRPYKSATPRIWGQELLLSPDDNGFHLFAIGGPQTILYDDPLLVLPQNLTAGAKWQDSGTARIVRNGAIVSVPYTYKAAAAAASDQGSGCLVIDATEVLGGVTGKARTTWCPGRGVVAEGDAKARTDFPTDADPAADIRLAAPDDWQGVSGWQHTEPQLANAVSIQPLLEPGWINSSTFAVSDSISGDMVGFVLGPKYLYPRWRAHPGGKILAQGQFGDIVVVATSRRQLVAYDQYGQYLWRAPTSDVIQTPIVRLDAGNLLTASLDGTVRAHDIRTGHVVWTYKSPVEIRVRPVSDGSTAVVVDNTGNMVALAAKDGSELWTRSLPGAVQSIALSGGVVGVVPTQGARVEGYDLGSGSPQWQILQRDPVQALHPLAGGFAVTTNSGVRCVTAAGTVTWFHQLQAHSSTSTPGASMLIVGTKTTVLVLSADGKTLGEWPIPLDPTTRYRWLVPGYSQILVLESLGRMSLIGPNT